MAGAQARRSVTEHDAAQETAAYDALIAATPAGFLDACADVPRDATPIFVVGMPRTGTTLLERILGNHPQIKTCGELNDFRQQMQWVNNRRLTLTLDEDIGEYVARLDPTLLGGRYLAKTAWRAEGSAFYVDKHPMNFQWCGAILKALPHAKIIHLRRHPLDSCFSNLKELFAHKYYPYSYALDELATHYRNYARLMRHWHAIAPGRILDVRYEDLVSQPDVEAQARAGLPGPAGGRGRHRHPRQQDGHHDRQHAAAAPADPHPQRRRLAPLRGRHGAGAGAARGPRPRLRDARTRPRCRSPRPAEPDLTRAPRPRPAPLSFTVRHRQFLQAAEAQTHRPSVVRPPTRSAAGGQRSPDAPTAAPCVDVSRWQPPWSPSSRRGQ